MEHSIDLGSATAVMTDAWCLEMHAAYQCRSSGACCTAGWNIPVEGPTYERLVVHFADRATRERLFVTGDAMPEGAAAIVGVRANGDCVFFEADRGRLCTVHRELGAGLLPAACRQFPRVARRDGRGTRISLSHFCPTAAALLNDSSSWGIVRAPRSLALDGLDSLDARDALPPLLHPRMLMDVEAYCAWEEQALALLGRDDVTAAGAVEGIARATREIQKWQPGTGSLRGTVEREFHVASVAEDDQDLGADDRRVRLVHASIPEGLPRPVPFDRLQGVWPEIAGSWTVVDRGVRAYLAARLFGNWMAYYGTGLHVIVEYLRTSLSVLKLESARHHAAASSPWQTLTAAARNADLLLVHLSEMKNLAQRLS